MEFEKYTSRTTEILLEVSKQSNNFKQFLKGLSDARSLSYGEAHERNRILRIWAIAYASDSDRMCKRLGEVQDRLNKDFGKFMAEGQEKGWFTKEVDPLMWGVFVQAYNLGTVLLNVSSEKIENEEWMKVLDRVAQKTIVQFE